jgi:hypothetical protein
VLAALLGLSGCSTLGIATSDEMLQARSRTDSLHRVQEASIANLQAEASRLEQNKASMQTALDTLNQRFDRAKAYFDSLDLESIRNNIDAVNQRSLSVSESYLAWLKNQQQFLAAEIAELEAKEGAGASAADGATETP